MSVKFFKLRNKICYYCFIPAIIKILSHQFLPGRKFLLTLFLVVISFSIFAQKFEGGLLAGFNGSQVRGDLSNGFHKLGFVGGVWVQTDVSDKFYLSGELKFNQKGSRINPNFKNNYLLYIYRLNYIDLPVSVGYKYTDFLSFFGGLSFGYLISSSVIDNYGVDPNFTYSDLNSYEIGMFVGAKIDFDKIIERDWASKFKLDLRYQFSAMSIYNGNDMFFYYSPYGQFNSLISTALYYTIDLGTVQ